MKEDLSDNVQQFCVDLNTPQQIYNTIVRVQSDTVLVNVLCDIQTKIYRFNI